MVSIVLPTYNGEKYIRESIDSILKQTYQNWELIVVDDCSTDSTLQIVREYAKNDFRIKVIHNEVNQKLPSSLNIGFDASVGKYLTWTSDDNIYLPEAIEKMREYLVENADMHMVCADMKVIDEENKLEGYTTVSYQQDLMYSGNYVGACFMYERDVMEQIGKYDADMFLVEDYDYWLRILRHYGVIGNINQVLYQYRMHGNSLTVTKQAQIRVQLGRLRKKNIDWILEHLKYKKALVCSMYYDFLEIGEDIRDIEEKILEIVPELMIDGEKEKDTREFIIFGAGNYGAKAAKYLGKRAAFFSDSDISKVGKMNYGIKIISTEEMLKRSEQYNIIIAAGSEKIFDMLQFLYKNGVQQCYTYQKMIANRLE